MYSTIAAENIESYKIKQAELYGFCADYTKAHWQNKIDYILQLPKSIFTSIITNKTCHNYCDPRPIMPTGVPSILGLGLKFCIKTPRPANKLKATITRFETDVRRIDWIRNNPPETEPGEISYIPELYIKGDWEPPSAGRDVEAALSAFTTALRTEQARYNVRTLSNLTPRQWNYIQSLRSNLRFIIIEADKNLGGCILLRDTYISRAISEHLSNRAVYQLLTAQEALTHVRKLRRTLRDFMATWRARRVISKAEYVFLDRYIDQNKDRFARFRMSLKAHKNPWKMRPIVCCVGTSLNGLSVWLDYWFQKLVPLIPTYLRDSKHLLDLLADLGPLPPNAKIFAADANSMYTNIDTTHAIQVITSWLDSLSEDLPEKFPLGAVKEAMEIVMCNNTFIFGDLHFLQLLGTAMGTSAACMWATIYFAVHEIDTLLSNYDSHLLLFRRYIDDMIGIWLGDDTTWENFKRDTNNFGILTWDFEEPSHTVNFLDLTISIENCRIVTRTYQKPMNLYQYIPPHSNHPPNMIKGIIYGLVSTFYRQNTKTEDYHDIVLKTFHRFVARGWSKSTIKSLILWADERTKTKTAPTTLPTTTPTLQLTPKEQLFCHLTFHSCDIPRRRIRALYNYHCSDAFSTHLGVDQFTVCYSRPNNIRDTLTKAKLAQQPGREASKFYSGELP